MTGEEKMIGAYANKLSIALMLIGGLGIYEYFEKPGRPLGAPLLLFGAGLVAYLILRKHRASS